MDSISKRSYRGAVWSLLQSGSRQFLGAVVFFLLAKFFLGPEEFGLVAKATLVVHFVNIVVTAGFPLALVQRKSISVAHSSSVFWLALTIAIVMALAIFLVAEWLAAFYRDPALEPVLKVVALLPMITALSAVQEALLMRELRYKSLAIRTTLATVCAGSVGLFCAVCGLGAWALVIMHIVNASVAAIFLWTVVDWRPKMLFSPRCLADLLPVGSSVFGSGIVSYLNKLADQLVIASALPTSSLGTYSVAKRIYDLLVSLSIAGPAGVALASFSAVQDDRKRMLRGYLRGQRVVSIIAFPLFLQLSVFSEVIVDVVLGSQWSGVASVIRWMGIGGIFHICTYLNFPLLVARGQSKLAFFVPFFGSILLLTLSYFAVGFGVQGVAIAFALKGLIMAVVWTIVMARVSGQGLLTVVGPFRSATLCSITSVLTVVGIRSVIDQSSAGLLSESLTASAGIAVYFGCAYWMEKDLLFDLLGKIGVSNVDR